MGGMTNEPRRRGPKPKGQPRRKVIAFGVSPEHHGWLTALPNRSAWLAEMIEKHGSSADKSAAPKTANEIPQPNADTAQ